MIKVDILVGLIKNILQSGKVKDENPLSTIIVAPPEHGKSELLSLFAQNKSVSWCNDLSSNPLITKILPSVEKGDVSHIVIPDFLKILSHGRKTTQSLLTCLNSLTAEGIKNIYFFGVEREFDFPLKAGVVLAITSEAFERRKKYWKEIGFLSRCIPITYRYSDSTMAEIHKLILTGGYGYEDDIDIYQRKKDIPINDELAKAVSDLQDKWRTKVESYTGFRLHKQFRTLIKSIAYKDGEVNPSHLKTLMECLNYVNFDFNLL